MCVERLKCRVKYRMLSVEGGMMQKVKWCKVW